MMPSDPNAPSDSRSEAEIYAAAEEAHQTLSGMIIAALKMRGRKLRAAKASLPVTVISGFLGAGKTTLLNHLLREPGGRRLAVLVNDFGRINVDADLVRSQTQDLISLTNGCACCAVGDDLTQALIDISERDEHPDAIVLEASGIADARGIFHIALSNPTIRLDGVVAVVDAETVLELAEDPQAGRILRNQIAAADLIALSKLDLLSPSKHAVVKQWIAARFADTPVIETINGKLPTDVVLGIGASRNEHMEWKKSEEDHVHDFESFSFTTDEPLDGARLQSFFDSLPKSLWRAKGVVNLDKTPTHRTVYQRVGSRWSFSPAEPWGDETPYSSLVFIGPSGSLDASALKSGLNQCISRINPTKAETRS